MLVQTASSCCLIAGCSDARISSLVSALLSDVSRVEGTDAAAAACALAAECSSPDSTTRVLAFCISDSRALRRA